MLVAGRRCPLVGAVSMDIAIADVTDLAGVAIGDEVVVLGRVPDASAPTTSPPPSWPPGPGCRSTR
ncbi:MAG: hypothetical protein IPJ61_21360 [Tessaracoccus sp.]|nr:hypothetical protein [Tessaracoccus sp.]